MDTKPTPIRGTYRHPTTTTPHEYEGAYWGAQDKTHWRVIVRRPDGSGKLGHMVGEPSQFYPAPLESLKNAEAEVRHMIEDAIRLRIGVMKEDGE